VIVVSFRLDVEKEAPFSEFYHHRYLPNLMRDVPEIKSARRYQEHHVTGSLRYYAKQFLTLLDCGSPGAEQNALAASGGDGRGRPSAISIRRASIASVGRTRARRSTARSAAGRSSW
jgi:hypothetical protein